MLRRLGFLSVLPLLGGCDNISDLPPLQKDSGVVSDGGTRLDGGKDAAEPVTDEPLVTNGGAACADDSECQGAAATCQTSFGAGLGGGMAITFPGGYCTATCTEQEQCGVGSECGVKKLIDTIEPFLMMSGTTIPPGFLDMIPSQCLDLCSTSTACREGYKCQSLIDAAGLGGQLPIPTQFLSRYCLPPVMPPSFGMDAGGTPEAGVDSDASPPPSDASTRMEDASATDAGGSDAGSSSDASTSN